MQESGVAFGRGIRLPIPLTDARLPVPCARGFHCGGAPVTAQSAECVARGFVVATQICQPAEPPARFPSLRRVGKVARDGTIGGRGLGVAARGFGNTPYGVACVRGARLARIFRGQADEDGQGVGILVPVPQRASPLVQSVHGLRRIRILRDDALPFVHRGLEPTGPGGNVGQQQQAVRP